MKFEHREVECEIPKQVNPKDGSSYSGLFI